MQDNVRRIIQKALEFHGFPMPGVALGVLMVDYATGLLEKVEKLGLTIETWHCIPGGAVVAQDVSTTGAKCGPPRERSYRPLRLGAGLQTAAAQNARAQQYLAGNA